MIRFLVKAWRKYRAEVRYRKFSLEDQIKRQGREIALKKKRKRVTYSYNLSIQIVKRPFKRLTLVFLIPFKFISQKLVEAINRVSLFYKRLILKNAYFVNFHPENLTIYNAVRLRYRGVPELEASIENDIYEDPDEIDGIVYSEYRRWVAYEFPILNILSYALLISIIIAFFSMLANCGVGVIYSQLNYAPTWYNRVQPLSFEFFNYAALLMMLFWFEMECDFLGGFIPFYLFWPSIINFGVSFNTNAYRRHGKNIAKITGEPKPLRKFIILGQNGSVGAKSWSDDTLLKRPSPLLPLLDRYRDIGDVLDDETVSSDEAGKFNISAQLETSIHDFVHTRGRAKGRVLLCKHKQFNIDNQVAMHKYSLNRVRFNELNKNKATDLEFSATPSQLIHHLTHGYNCRLNYKCIAKLEESKIDNFLELEKERLNSNWKSINLQRKTY